MLILPQIKEKSALIHPQSFLIATVQWRTSTMTTEYKSAVEMARR